MAIDFTYLMQPPKRYTFEQPKLKNWVESWCKGKVLNLFAGKIKLDVDEIRNDLDPEMPADYHLDAYQLVKEWKEAIDKVADAFGKKSGMPKVCGERIAGDFKFDTVVLDPPYSVRKAREKYGGRYLGSPDVKECIGILSKIKDNLLPIMNPNGRVISLGFDTVGMSRSRGFRKIAICLVCHSGDHSDTLCLVEERTDILDDFEEEP